MLEFENNYEFTDDLFLNFFNFDYTYHEKTGGRGIFHELPKFMKFKIKEIFLDGFHSGKSGYEILKNVQEYISGQSNNIISDKYFDFLYGFFDPNALLHGDIDDYEKNRETFLYSDTSTQNDLSYNTIGMNSLDWIIRFISLSRKFNPAIELISAKYQNLENSNLNEDTLNKIFYYALMHFTGSSDHDFTWLSTDDRHSSAAMIFNDWVVNENPSNDWEKYRDFIESDSHQDLDIIKLATFFYLYYDIASLFKIGNLENSLRKLNEFMNQKWIPESFGRLTFQGACKAAYIKDLDGRQKAKIKIFDISLRDYVSAFARWRGAGFEKGRMMQFYEILPDGKGIGFNPETSRYSFVGADLITSKFTGPGLKIQTKISKEYADHNGLAYNYRKKIVPDDLIRVSHLDPVKFAAGNLQNIHDSLFCTEVLDYDAPWYLTEKDVEAKKLAMSGVAMIYIVEDAQYDSYLDKCDFIGHKVPLLSISMYNALQKVMKSKNLLFDLGDGLGERSVQTMSFEDIIRNFVSILEYSVSNRVSLSTVSADTAHRVAAAFGYEGNGNALPINNGGVSLGYLNSAGSITVYGQSFWQISKYDFVLDPNINKDIINIENFENIPYDYNPFISVSQNMMNVYFNRFISQIDISGDFQIS